MKLLQAARAFGVAFALVVIGAVAGWQGDDAMFCGLLMVVLGTGMQVYPEAHAGAPAAQGRARQADA